MIKKIRKHIKQFFEQQNEILKFNKELEWANIYHDSIRGKDYLERLPLNIGRWAGNYSFFYVLNRILNDYKPQTILEMGLGESTKFVMAYLDNELKETKHIVIEQDENWKNSFLNLFPKSKNTEIKVYPFHKVTVKGFNTNSYQNLADDITEKFDLYIIDGPFGSINYSRYDIINLARNFEKEDEFIIVLDDYNRQGEKETANDLFKLLSEKGIKYYNTSYSGVKSVLVIATEKYRFAKSF